MLSFRRLDLPPRYNEEPVVVNVRETGLGCHRRYISNNKKLPAFDQAAAILDGLGRPL